MKQVSGEVKGFSGLIKQNSAQIKKMGRQMAIGGAAIVGTIGLMVKAFATFDEAMVKSLAIMGDISPAMRKEMAETAKQMSTETTFAAKELAESYFFLASAGMDAEQSIAALPAVARFAQAGTFDLALATDLLTDAQTAMGLSSKDAEINLKNLINVSDVLVKANTLANASVQQFSESLTNRAAPALINVKKSMEEGVAVLAAYADKGIKGRKAGMQLGMMLNALDIAARDNKEGWDALGLSLFDSEGEMRHMGDLIADMEVLLGDMSTEQRGATLATLGFTAETKNSILTLLGSSEKIKKWSKDLKDAGGITKEVSDKQLKAFNAQVTMLKNTVIKGAIAIGTRLAPMIEGLTKKVKTVVARVTTWIEKHPKLTEWIGKLALAVGALLTVLGPLVMMLPGLAVGFGLVKVAVLTLAGPVGIAAAALVGIALAIKDIIKTHKEAIKAMSDMAMGAAIMANAAENFKKLWIVVRKEGGPALDDFNELMTRFGGNWDKILKQIIADPKLAVLKAMLIKVARTVKGITTEGENLEITLPGSFVKVSESVKKAIPVFTSWATTLGNIFHDVSVRIAKMQGSIKSTSFVVGGALGDFEKGFVNINKAAVKAAKLPPFAVNIPKMSLKDLRDFYLEWLQEFEDKSKLTFQRIIDAANLFTTSLGNLFSQMHENEIQRIENEFQKRKDAIDASLMSDQEKFFAIEKLNREMDKKRLKAQKAQAKRTKALSLMEAIVNTAAAVAQALKAPFPLSLILPGIIGAMGAIQIALIAAQPLPTFARGGSIAEGEAGIIGERGPELFVPDTAGTIVPLREGAGGALRPIFLSIAPTFQISAIDEVGVDEFMRLRGLPAIVEAIKVGIQKPELQDALRIK